ncbi:MAG: hypothetical protein KGJ90_00675 [Patescibacteria group bacterium]|nr:hypothetical protein [Patescibacteria group bacterium]
MQINANPLADVTAAPFGYLGQPISDLYTIYRNKYGMAPVLRPLPGQNAWTNTGKGRVAVRWVRGYWFLLKPKLRLADRFPALKGGGD